MLKTQILLERIPEGGPRPKDGVIEKCKELAFDSLTGSQSQKKKTIVTKP